MNKKEETPYSFYLWLQHKLCEISTPLHHVNKKEALAFMHHYRIPKIIRPIVLREMEHAKLIKTIDQYKIEIINIDKNHIVNEEINKLYEVRGLWEKMSYPDDD